MQNIFCMANSLDTPFGLLYHASMNLHGKTNPEFFPLQYRTIYAEALERLEELEAGNVMAALTSCSWFVKTVHGREYVYAQGRVADGSNKQVYLGPYNDRTKLVLERFDQGKAEAVKERKSIDALGKLLRGAGMPGLDPVEWRVVAALAADGVFRVGGVLVGTIAYRCLAGLLGVRLASASAFTADIDIAGNSVPVGIIPEVVCPQSALDRLEMGFSPMMEADPALYGTRLQTRDGDFKVEFLTPLTGKDDGKQVEIRQLGVPAIPLRFLDYLIADPVRAIALGRKPVLVQVPAPERFAVHKLIVSQERQKLSLKSQKDLEQSFDLQQVLQKLDPAGLEEAFAQGRDRGPGWARRIDKGQEAMIRLFGDPREAAS